MLLNVEAGALVRQAQDAAARAASAARVRVIDEFDPGGLREISALFMALWGTSARGAPIPAEILRSISHAGCNVTAAYDVEGTLCGAASAIVSPNDSSAYSLIAGVLPRAADSGVGFALKQHQRAWALTRGLTTMSWTFDPLVSRNARFNLTKLGAHVSEYVNDFYGPMEDEINSNDESDRLVAVWPLASDRVIACSEGKPEPVDLPTFSPDDVRMLGPDGHPILVDALGSLWCRAPVDIVALRGQDRGQAATWRTSVRDVFTTAFASGHVGSGVTRSGWYRLETGEQK